MRVDQKQGAQTLQDKTVISEGMSMDLTLDEHRRLFLPRRFYFKAKTRVSHPALCKLSIGEAFPQHVGTGTALPGKL